MDYPAFEVFGTQHLITLLICAAVVYLYPKYFENKNSDQQVLGGKILAGIMILHMVTQPIYDVLLFDLPWRGEFPLHCLLYTSPSPRDRTRSRMPSSA